MRRVATWVTTTAQTSSVTENSRAVPRNLLDHSLLIRAVTLTGNSASLSNGNPSSRSFSSEGKFWAVGRGSCRVPDTTDGHEMLTASVTFPASLFATQMYIPVSGDELAVEVRSPRISTPSVRRAPSSTAPGSAAAADPRPTGAAGAGLAVDGEYLVVRPFGWIQNSVGAGSPVAEHFSRPVTSPSAMSMLLNTGAYKTVNMQAV